jgi:organic hydroperoxide reductase OsmC/OhrA
MQKPFVYSTTVRWTEERAGILGSSGKQELGVSAPVELGGTPGRWAPEELLLASVNVCLMASFLAFADRADLPFRTFESVADGRAEMVNGRLVFTAITVRPKIGLVHPGDVQRAQDVLTKAEAHCIVTSSLKVPVAFDPYIA